ncbi:MAG: metal ABC transporter ATP-binding protein [Candidatus Dormibacter sp.]|uniref:metal ABC transporter ATP-binding protein n=1 Tax=Candidatus Dormibacter sp. TaxID=2973982 RepID=UPI002683ADC6
MTEPPAVYLERVSARYGSLLALQDATASAPAGSFVCLVGLNGAGKSTLLKAVVGIVTVSGRVAVAGLEGSGRRRLLAYVPQREDINWTFPASVLDVVLMGRQASLRRIGWTAATDREAALGGLEQVGLAELRERSIGELSGGQQQRVMLARALFSQAPVLLLDEPLSGVDPASQDGVLRLLHAFCSRGGTVLMATHDVVGSARMADRVWGVNGTVVADLPADRLLRRDTLELIYGEHLLVLPDGGLALGDQAR